MSQENVGIVRRLVPVKDRRPDEYVPYLYPEVEIIPAANFPDSEIFRGHAGFERWKTRWPSTFDKHEIEPTRFWDGGDQVVVVELHERALVAGSSTFVERRFAHVWTFREGAVTPFRSTTNRPKRSKPPGYRSSRPLPRPRRVLDPSLSR